MICNIPSDLEDVHDTGFLEGYVSTKECALMTVALCFTKWESLQSHQGPKNHVKTDEGPGDCDCERHSEVCDWRESVPDGTRYISLREICGRLAGGMFQGRFGIDVGYTFFTSTCKRRLDDCVPLDAVTRN